MNKRMKKQGFTLIELLIVVGLLAALTAVMLPQFTDRRQDAVDATQQHNAIGVDRTLRQYRALNGVWPTLWNTGTLIEDDGEGNDILPMIPDALRDALAAADVLEETGGNWSVASAHTFPSDALNPWAQTLHRAGLHVFVTEAPMGFRSAGDLLAGGGPPALATGYAFPEDSGAILLAPDTDIAGVTFQGRPLSELCSTDNEYRALLVPVTEDIYWTMKANGQDPAPAVPARAQAWGGGSDVKLESVPKLNGDYMWAVFRVNSTSMGGRGLVYLLGVMDANLNTYQ